ncbi:MAG: TetR family transcriptional regulator [Rhizobiales bacterium]|nr:TetR family transcriptional regulator [Hyphomicrobiales bacterium]
MGLEVYRRTVSEAKRASILAAARKNFLVHGLSHAAMAEIAHDADVSTATLYKHFESKEELFKCVVQDSFNPLGDELVVELSRKTTAEALLELAHSYLDAQFNGDVNSLLRMVIAEVPGEPELAREMFKQCVDQRYTRLERVLEELIKRDQLIPHDTYLSARFVGGMLKELYVWPAMFDQSFKLPDDVDDKINAVIQVFLKAYGA